MTDENKVFFCWEPLVSAYVKFLDKRCWFDGDECTASGFDWKPLLFACWLSGAEKGGARHSVTLSTLGCESRAIVDLGIAQPEQNGCRRPARGG
jgi:hypothetical protein